MYIEPCTSQAMNTENKLNVSAVTVFSFCFQFLISDVLTAWLSFPHYVLSNLLGIVVAGLQGRVSVGLRMYVHYITA